MKRNIWFINLVFILVAGCSNSKPVMEIGIQDTLIPSHITTPLVSVTPSPDNSPELPVFTEEEMFQFELLRADWTKEQMEAEGLEKEVIESGDLTIYSNQVLTYTYFDWFNTLTPAVVDVFGDVPGPRGIRVGDSFEQVLALFPQDKDWKSDPHGFFYGDIENEYDPLEYALTGYVREYEAGKEISLVVEGGFPFLRIFFEDDIMTHYTFYLIAAD